MEQLARPSVETNKECWSLRLHRRDLSLLWDKISQVPWNSKSQGPANEFHWASYGTWLALHSYMHAFVYSINSHWTLWFPGTGDTGVNGTNATSVPTLFLKQGLVGKPVPLRSWESLPQPTDWTKVRQRKPGHWSVRTHQFFSLDRMNWRTQRWSKLKTEKIGILPLTSPPAEVPDPRHSWAWAFTRR